MQFRSLGEESYLVFALLSSGFGDGRLVLATVDRIELG